ncbi:hypothetical protein [Lacticaseibacillus absianus]|uniref:hypothetical protein n=1 Tax=Lacticaseibacillus absianus TaxID=2729623 RepID=UPI0015C8F6CD|nr:hypothetical protein [Lacticaseibacillus absianus]
MEINVQAFQDAIAADNYQVTQLSVTPTQVADQGLDQCLRPAFAALDAALDQGVLAQVDLVITSAEPTTLRLETGVINLPLADSKKVNNFLDETAMVPLKLNLIVISPYVNQSGLRIDTVASADEYQQHRAADQAVVIAEAQEKLALIEAVRTAPKPVVKEAPAARATTKKPATRRTAAKKAPTTKATTRKPAAKKPATKRATTAKKAPTTKAKPTK